MTKVVMRKLGATLIPAEDEAAELVARIPDGKDVVVDVRQSRNPKHHRMYWALMNILAENVDWIDDRETASKLVKVACHEVDEYIDAATGQIFYEIRSINFESMDQGRFGRFFDRALYVITSRWLVGNDVEELRQRVFELVDGPEAASLGRRAA